MAQNGPKTDRIQSLFDSIATDYDRLNHMLSLGIDRTWRRRSLKYIIDKNSSQQILDIACGTGDFSIAISEKAHPETRVTGLDLSKEMLKVMNRKVAASGCWGRIRAEQGNCEQMRFPDASFDRATIAFGVRNFENREAALREILRVLRPGGKLVILELSMPENRHIRKIYSFYFTKILPWIGGRISGDRAAYNYLPASVLKFPSKNLWMATMAECGYRKILHKSYTFGICRLYVGEK